jgi:hypothetical protein
VHGHTNAAAGASVLPSIHAPWLFAKKKRRATPKKIGFRKNTKIGDGDGRCPAQKKYPPISLNKKISVSIFFENTTVRPWYYILCTVWYYILCTVWYYILLLLSLSLSIYLLRRRREEEEEEEEEEVVVVVLVVVVVPDSTQNIVRGSTVF